MSTGMAIGNKELEMYRRAVIHGAILTGLLSGRAASKSDAGELLYIIETANNIFEMVYGESTAGLGL